MAVRSRVLGSQAIGADARAFFGSTRSWQWIKHTILADYLRPWSMKVGSSAAEIWVVDAFAGAGTYVDPQGQTAPGSPLIAAREALHYERERPNRRMRVLCVEKNRGNYKQLCENLSPFDDFVVHRHGDFVDHVEEILAITAGNPVLLLLDPFGLSPLRATACRRLLGRSGKTDAFVIALFQVAHRTAGQLTDDLVPDPRIASATATCRNIDAFFDTPEWRRIGKDQTLRIEDKELAWLTLYSQRVVPPSYGYRCAHEVRPRPGGPIKYWIVQLSQHPDAFWLMNDAVVKADEGLLQQHYQQDGQLLGLGDSVVDGHRAEHQTHLERRVLEFLAERGGTMEFEQLRDELVKEFFGKVKQGAYSRVIKALVRSGHLTRQEAKPHAAIKPAERIGIAAPLGAEDAPLLIDNPAGVTAQVPQ